MKLYPNSLIFYITIGLISAIFLTEKPIIAGYILPVDSARFAEFSFFSQNEHCLKCHGSEYYYLSDTLNDLKEKRIMCANYMINRVEFYQSNHKNFACLDCHSDAFHQFPHSIEGRMEEMYACLDCHGGDETFSQYHFEGIQMEYDKSTHALIEGFSCWKCHDPHSYKITARTSGRIKEIIQYDNKICLECHGNFRNFMLLTDRDEISILDEHEWLPNQIAHFSSVRCIECHTRINDTILISHELLPKKDAVRRCTECHTSDSRLMASLYKFQIKEQRKMGFINGIIINESYVIAANRNVYLNILSMVLFGLLVLSISVHIIFRILKLKKE